MFYIGLYYCYCVVYYEGYVGEDYDYLVDGFYVDVCFVDVEEYFC